MKYFVAVLALAALAAADVSHILPHATGEAGAQIVGQQADVRPDGYESSYQTSNGISGQEAGIVKNFGRDDEEYVVQGENTYTAPDGKVIRTVFTADKYGYHPQGDHLPTPPAPQPIPEYIARALAYIEAHPPAPENFQRV